MAYRRKSYTYWDGDAIFPIPFEYLEQDDILVFINDEPTTDFVIENTQVKLNNIPTEVPAIIKIVSATDIDKAIVDWENVSSLDEDNLILSDNQIRYAVQELYDNTEQFKTDTNKDFSNFREEIHTLLDDVSEAAELISSTIEAVDTAVITTQEQALLATEQKELATEQANIATQQTELVASTANKALEDIETLTTNSAQAIETLSEISKQEIEVLSNTIKTDANDIINTTRLKMGMTVVLDKVLSFEESQGLALQGTYVYKTAIAGERYGYPDFYEKYVDFKNNATATQTTLGSSTITIYTNANGLQFYNIADKGVVDTFFNSTGIADYYGVDEANERILLPRNNKFWQFTTNTGEVNDYVEAGLPNITGGFGSYASWDAYANGAFTKTTGAAGWKGGVDGVQAKVTLDASKSNSIYGNSNTVQPPSSKKLLYYVVGNTVSDTSWVDVVTQVEGGVKDLEDKTQEGIERLKASSNALTTTQITNCITEIPQDIKLELNEGVLTLKAGSKVYVPNGFEADGTTPKFDEVIIESDLSDTYIDSKPYCFFSTKNGTSHTVNQVATCNSGNTDAGTGWHVWYNTSTNKIIRYNGDGEIIADDCSLPVCIYSGETTITSIDQTFNGFGYIGSTIWVDKGVKGLIPNGRNEDGTLKHTEFITEKIITSTLTNNIPRIIAIDANHIQLPNTSDYRYNQETNYNLYKETTQAVECIVGLVEKNNNGINVFQTKQPFQALDYSDKSTISGWAMPSSKYIDLTLGASGSTYIAPANGYLFFEKVSSASGQYANTQCSDANGVYLYGSEINATASGNYVRMTVPISKGMVAKIAYSLAGTTRYFRFIYAQGEV